MTLSCHQTAHSQLDTEWLPFGPTDVVDVPVLLSGEQMLALEEAANNRGLTAAELIRQLLRDLVVQPTAVR